MQVAVLVAVMLVVVVVVVPVVPVILVVLQIVVYLKLIHCLASPQSSPLRSRTSLR